MIRFVCKQPFDLTTESILEQMADVKPEIAPRDRYFVSIGNQKFPAKQVLSVVTGFPRLMFHSRDAVKILYDLGFDLTEVDCPRARPA